MPQTGPASISSTAWRAVTPHDGSASVIAQSSDDGPRSPFGPGCTMIVRHRIQTSAGTRSRRNGTDDEIGIGVGHRAPDGLLVTGALRP